MEYVFSCLNSSSLFGRNSFTFLITNVYWVPLCARCCMLGSWKLLGWGGVDTGSLGVAFRNGQDWDIRVFSLLCSSDFELFRFEGVLNLSSKKTLLVSMCHWHGEPPANVHTVCIKCRIALDIRKQSWVMFNPCTDVQFYTYFSSHLSFYSLFWGW